MEKLRTKPVYKWITDLGYGVNKGILSKQGRQIGHSENNKDV